MRICSSFSTSYTDSSVHLIAAAVWSSNVVAIISFVGTLSTAVPPPRRARAVCFKRDSKLYPFGTELLAMKLLALAARKLIFVAATSGMRARRHE
jgi:hypothetical protein